MGDFSNIKPSRKKWCFVPRCTNTSINNPEKIFISVPNNLQRKKRWFSAARRELKEVSIKTHFYCCEDHFKLEQDMENYMEWKMMGVQKRMKKNVVPHIFVCQEDSPIPERMAVVNRASQSIIQDVLCEGKIHDDTSMENDKKYNQYASMTADEIHIKDEEIHIKEEEIYIKDEFDEKYLRNESIEDSKNLLPTSKPLTSKRTHPDRDMEEPPNKIQRVDCEGGSLKSLQLKFLSTEEERKVERHKLEMEKLQSEIDFKEVMLKKEIELKNLEILLTQKLKEYV